jgi:hypothetical protein
LRDFQIAADFPGRKFDDFPVARHCGTLLVAELK